MATQRRIKARRFALSATQRFDRAIARLKADLAAGRSVRRHQLDSYTRNSIKRTKRHARQARRTRR